MTVIAAVHRRIPQTRARVRQFVTGGTMVVLATVGLSAVIRIGSTMALTRLLDAEAYGVIGLVLSISYALTMLSDLSFAPYVIRHAEGADPRFLDRVWTLRLLRSIGLTALLAVTAPLFARYAHQPSLAPVLRAYSIFFALDGLASLTFATAIREQQLRRLSTVELGTSVFQTLLSIALAALWHSYWAILVALIAGQALKTVLSYALFAGSRRRFDLNREQARDIWRFARLLIVSSLLTMVISQLDKFVLLRIMPLAAFGLYTIATALAVAPQQLVGPYVSRILLPVYAQAWRETPETLARTFYRRKRSVMLLYMAAVGGLMGCADLVVAILYDPRFTGVTPYLRLLAVNSLLVFNNDAAVEALIAAGRTAAPLHANIARIVWLVLFVTPAAIAGKVILIVAAVAGMELGAALYLWWLLGRLRVLNVGEEALGLLAAGAGGAAGFGLARLAFAVAHF